MTKSVEQKTCDLIGKLFEKQSYAESQYRVAKSAIFFGLGLINNLKNGFKDEEIREEISHDLQHIKELLEHINGCDEDIK